MPPWHLQYIGYGSFQTNHGCHDITVKMLIFSRLKCSAITFLLTHYKTSIINIFLKNEQRCYSKKQKPSTLPPDTVRLAYLDLLPEVSLWGVNVFPHFRIGTSPQMD